MIRGLNHDIAFEKYREHNALNGSTLAQLLPPKSPKHLNYCVQNDIHPDPDVTRVGTGLHAIVECLPVNNFGDWYTVMPDFKASPDNVTGTTKVRSWSATNWTRQQELEFRENEKEKGREVLKTSEMQRMNRMLRAIASNDVAMSLITTSHSEVSILEELAGTLCKGRTDGICGEGELWDLKACGAGIDERSFARVESQFHYIFKNTMHWMLLKAAGETVNHFHYILVDDCKPLEKTGQFNRPADCVVVDVPMTVLESHEEEVYEAIATYQSCLESGNWPGVQTYDYVPWTPQKQAQLVD